MNIYIANLDTQLKDEDLRNLFTPFGDVQLAEIAVDAFTDKSSGYGYVEMPDETQAAAAITALNQSELGGRVLTVQESKPKEERKGSYKVGNGAVNVYRFRKN